MVKYRHYEVFIEDTREGRSMGFLDNVKKTIEDNLPDVVTNPQISGQSGEMLYKFDKLAIIKGSRLIVSPSQEALFVQNGVIEAVFGPGSYNLETENIPIAKQLLALAYGGSSPNRAEIWFVNKAVVMDVAWGTPAPLSMEDYKFGRPLVIKVRCNGSISLRVVDSRQLFVEMVGQGRIFTIENFKEAMRGMMVSRLQKTVGEYMMANKTGFVQLQQNVSMIENPLKERMQAELDPYGLMIEGCYVKGFQVLEDDSWALYKKLESQTFEIEMEANRISTVSRAEAERLENLGTTYDRTRQFDVMDRAASNEGLAIGTPVGLGVGVATGAAIGNRMSIVTDNIFNNMDKKEKEKEKQQECPKCHASYQEGTKFCPECGFIVRKVCKGCGSAMEEEKKFCPECGKKLNFCLECGADNEDSAHSCERCGKSIGMLKACGACGFTPKAPMKFCPECGTSM